jgi:hypothetical protein
MPLRLHLWKIFPWRYLPPSFAHIFLNANFQAVRANLSEAQRVASGTGSETDKIEAQIEISVYEALQAALAK